MNDRLILASGSTSRASLLRSAGVQFEIARVSVDEPAVKHAMQAQKADSRDIADALADLKARKGSQKSPHSIVLGADQILECNGRIYDKPSDTVEAKEQLLSLRGQTHRLYSAAVIYENLQPVWRHVAVADLTMREFSDAFLEAYLKKNGDTVLHCVGAYQLEAEGLQLFSRVKGDFFTILGLQMLEILAFLRTRGICLQ